MFAGVGTRPGRRSLKAEEQFKFHGSWRAFLRSLGMRDVFASDRDYFVRTDGNDANDGWANTPGRAFKTMQRAIDVIAGLDMAAYKAAIHVANGTYDTQVYPKAYLGAGPVSIIGDETTPANVVVQPTVHNASEGIFNVVGVPGLYVLSGMKLTSSAAQGHGLLVAGCYLAFKKLEFGALATTGQQMQADLNGIIEARDDYLISGSADRHAGAIRGGVIRSNAFGSTAVDVTLSGTPAFTTAFAVAQDGGIVRGATSYTGLATGKRYQAETLGLIRTQQADAGANNLPGNSPGSEASGGKYL